MKRLLLMVALVFPSLAGGQDACAPAEGGRWATPLDRLIRVGAGLPVRDAIDRAGRQAGVTFAYSVDLLPAGATSCTAASGVRLGDALALWLSGSTLEPVITGPDRIMLVPGRRPQPPADGVSDSLPAPALLAQVRVEEARGIPLVGMVTAARTIVDRAAIEASGASTIAQLLTTHVPGMWIWTPSPSSLGAAVASLRGASSFGASYPKVYVDGVEVANPLFLAQLAPDQVARIEVIRGPQGAALYGSGAVSGVIEITTLQASGLSAPSHLSVRSSAGVSESAYAPLGAFVQEHAFSGRMGREDRSLSAGLAMATTGAFVPGAYSRQLQGTVGAAVLGARARWQFTARGVSQEAGNPLSPLLPAAQAAPASSLQPHAAIGAPEVTLPWDSTRAQSVREYTVASTLAFERALWSHQATAGVDGYVLDNLAATAGRYRTPGDSALLSAAGNAQRVSLRWSGNRHFVAGTVGTGAVTFGLDQSSLRDATRGASFAPAQTGESAIWRHTTGLMAQGEITWRGAFVLNGGLRLEHNVGYTLLSGVETLPTVGAAWRHTAGPTAITLRGSYGRAIQQPRVGSRDNPWGGRSPAVVVLEPESQAGFEYGFDLRYGTAATVSLTRFDQRATNLIQPVLSTGPGGRGLTTRLENIGAIDNRGWELEGRVTRGALNLTGSLGLTDSRVERLARGYQGDLRPNDRVLQVPAHTVSLAANWLGRGWSATANVARAGNWINYDWLSLTSADRPPTGDALRGYWLRYPGTTRVGLVFTREVTSAFELMGSAENLLGTQRGEPDNVTIVPGRTMRAGLRAKF
ncbi:MAG: TonB-dependent receptor [Gemmatimonadetes bacterium]|nr:TonB-dependent receptor [Gemmatimonadota bacterium]